MSASLQQAHQELYAALNDMLAGKTDPILTVWSESDDISYGGPFGEFAHGRTAVTEISKKSRNAISRVRSWSRMSQPSKAATSVTPRASSTATTMSWTVRL